VPGLAMRLYGRRDVAAAPPHGDRESSRAHLHGLPGADTRVDEAHTADGCPLNPDDLAAGGTAKSSGSRVRLSRWAGPLVVRRATPETTGPSSPSSPAIVRAVGSLVRLVVTASVLVHPWQRRLAGPTCCLLRSPGRSARSSLRSTSGRWRLGQSPPPFRPGFASGPRAKAWGPEPTDDVVRRGACCGKQGSVHEAKLDAGRTAVAAERLTPGI